MKPETLWNHVSKGGNVAAAIPPSDVIRSAYQHHKGIPPRDIVEKTAEKVLLPVDEVEMWFDHVKQTSENRAKGAKKAAETRKRRDQQRKGNGTQNSQPNAATTTTTKAIRKETQVDREGHTPVLPVGSETVDNVLCKECGRSEPPQAYSGEDLDIPWIQCDSCDSWFHMDCTGLSASFSTSDLWICHWCNEQW